MAYKSKITLDKMIELYNQGHGTNDIAKMYGYKNDEYITSKLKQAGVYKANRLDTGKILALRKAGWSIKDIAMDCVASIEQIEEVLNDRI